MLWVLAKRERTVRAHFMNCNNSKWMRWSESPIENFSVLIFALLRQVWKGMSKRWAIHLIHTLSLDLPTDFHAVYMRSEIYLLPQCICTNRKILWASIWELQWMCVCVCIHSDSLVRDVDWFLPVPYASDVVLLPLPTVVTIAVSVRLPHFIVPILNASSAPFVHLT